jgi:hypothetical protein
MSLALGRAGFSPHRRFVCQCSPGSYRGRPAHVYWGLSRPAPTGASMRGVCLDRAAPRRLHGGIHAAPPEFGVPRAIPAQRSTASRGVYKPRAIPARPGPRGFFVTSATHAQTLRAARLPRPALRGLHRAKSLTGKRKLPSRKLLVWERLASLLCLLCRQGSGEKFRRRSPFRMPRLGATLPTSSGR